jgi:signal peptidase I
VDVYRDYIVEGNIDCFGQHWVDDLAVECLADVTGSQGELTLQLVRAGAHHLCRINLADGKATMSMIDPAGREIAFASDDGKQATSPTAQTSVRGPGKYGLRLSNCDHEMLLWVNGSVVKFDGPTTYDTEGDNDLPVPYYSASDPGDLAPAGVASRGAAVNLSQLRIYRDKYYIAINANNTDYERAPPTERIHQIFRDPSQWSATEGLFADGNRGHEQFLLEKDQFLPLGDNSPQSSDARFWGGHHYVERDLLIGKALLIYWPHTWNSPLPFMPNFRRMGPIR